jgi:hypothetical protein
MLKRLSVLLVLLVLAGTTQVSRADVSQKGTVVRIADGDTVDVDVWGDGTTKPVTIRNAGLQAMELGECHADAAKAAMSAAAMGKTVQLTSATSNTLSLGRPVRFVDAVDGTTSVDTPSSRSCGEDLPCGSRSTRRRGVPRRTTGRWRRPPRSASGCGTTTPVGTGLPRRRS